MAASGGKSFQTSISIAELGEQAEERLSSLVEGAKAEGAFICIKGDFRAHASVEVITRPRGKPGDV